MNADTASAATTRAPHRPNAIRPNTRSAVFWGPVVLAVGSGSIENSKYAPTWAIKSAKQAGTDSHRTTGRTIADMVSLPWRNVHPQPPLSLTFSFANPRAALMEDARDVRGEIRHRLHHAVEVPPKPQGSTDGDGRLFAIGL